MTDDAAASAASHVASVEQPVPYLTLHHLIDFGEDVAKEAILVVLIALVVRKQVAKAIAEKIAEEFTKVLSSVTAASTHALTQITSSFDNALRDNEARFRVVLQRMEDRIVGDWSGTLRHFREAVVYEAWEKRGAPTAVIEEARKLIDEKQFARAAEKLRSAKDSDWDALKQLVDLLLSQHLNRPDEALAALRSREAIFRGNHEFQWELARVHMAQNNKALAIEAAFAYVQLTKSLGLDVETRASALISLGYTYYWFDDYASAIVQTEEALATLGAAPERLDLLLAYRANLAYYYAELRQNRTEAEQYAEAAVQFSPRDPSFLDTRGFVRMQFAGVRSDATGQEIIDVPQRRADLEKAKTDFTLAGELDPTNGDYYAHLAQANQLLQGLG